MFNAPNLKVRQTGLAAFPTEVNSIERGKQPRFDFGVVAHLAAVGQQPRERLLDQFASVIFVSCEAVGKPIQPLVKRGNHLLIIHFMHKSVKSVTGDLFRKSADIIRTVEQSRRKGGLIR